MKRILPALLSAVLAVTLTSCLSSGDIASLLIDELFDESISGTESVKTTRSLAESESNSLGNALLDGALTLQSSYESMEEEYTPENNYYVGRCVAATIEQAYPLYTDAPITTAYLNYICSSIVINSDNPTLYKGYFVGIMDTDEINAMATPGGHIFVSKGLIRSVDSEDSLAAVIAHEVAHIQLEHSINAIKANKMTEATTQMLGNITKIITKDYVNSNRKLQALGISSEKFSQSLDELQTSVSSSFTTLVNTGYSREQEFEADNKALELMNNAGYDVVGMVDMLNLISDNSSNGGWNSTHPSAEERIANVDETLAETFYFATGKKARKARFAANTADIR